MLQLAKQPHLIPNSCYDFEFTIGETAKKDIIVLGLEYWETNVRYNDKGYIEPKKIGIPMQLQQVFNQYGKRVVKGINTF